MKKRIFGFTKGIQKLVDVRGEPQEPCNCDDPNIEFCKNKTYEDDMIELCDCRCHEENENNEQGE